MTYAEAVRRVQGMVSASAGTAMYEGDAQALAVLHRAEPVMSAVEGAALPEPNKPQFWACFQWETEEDDILRASLAFKEKP